MECISQKFLWTRIVSVCSEITILAFRFSYLCAFKVISNLFVWLLVLILCDTVVYSDENVSELAVSSSAERAGSPTSTSKGGDRGRKAAKSSNNGHHTVSNHVSDDDDDDWDAFNDDNSGADVDTSLDWGSISDDHPTPEKKSKKKSKRTSSKSPKKKKGGSSSSNRGGGSEDYDARTDESEETRRRGGSTAGGVLSGALSGERVNVCEVET